MSAIINGHRVTVQRRWRDFAIHMILHQSLEIVEIAKTLYCTKEIVRLAFGLKVHQRE